MSPSQHWYAYGPLSFDASLPFMVGVCCIAANGNQAGVNNGRGVVLRGRFHDSLSDRYSQILLVML